MKLTMNRPGQKWPQDILQYPQGVVSQVGLQDCEVIGLFEVAGWLVCNVRNSSYFSIPRFLVQPIKHCLKP